MANELLGPAPRTLSAAVLGESIGHSQAWIIERAKEGRLPGEQVPHPAVTGRTTWRFNLEEVQKAIESDYRLWDKRKEYAQRQRPEPPDNHHTLDSIALALALNLQLGTVRNMAARAEVPSILVGNRRWFNLEDVLAARAARKSLPRKDKGKPRAGGPPDAHHTLRGDELAAATGFSTHALKDWASAGEVPAVFAGVRWWHNLDDTCDALLRTGRLKRSQPVPHTFPYEEYTLTVGAAAAAVGLSVAKLTKITKSGLVPYAIGLEGFRMFNLTDLQEALRRNPHLVSPPRGISPREDPRHTPGPLVQPLRSPWGLTI